MFFGTASQLDIKEERLTRRLHQISGQCFPQDTPRKADEFAGLLAEDRLFAAAAAEKVTGFLLFQEVLDESEIHTVAVHPDFQRRGQGSKLLEAYLKHAEKKGIAKVFLEVRCGNQAAIALYKKKGFRRLAKRKNYYQNPVEDALVMYWGEE